MRPRPKFFILLQRRAGAMAAKLAKCSSLTTAARCEASASRKGNSSRGAPCVFVGGVCRRQALAAGYERLEASGASASHELLRRRSADGSQPACGAAIDGSEEDIIDQMRRDAPANCETTLFHGRLSEACLARRNLSAANLPCVRSLLITAVAGSGTENMALRLNAVHEAHGRRSDVLVSWYSRTDVWGLTHAAAAAAAAARVRLDPGCCEMGILKNLENSQKSQKSRKFSKFSKKSQQSQKSRKFSKFSKNLKNLKKFY